MLLILSVLGGPLGGVWITKSSVCGEKNVEYLMPNAFRGDIGNRETRGELGLIKYKGKYGFINNEGVIAIKPKYKKAEEFILGVGSVTKSNGKTMAFTPDGKRYKGMGKEIHGANRNCLTPMLKQNRIIQKDGKFGFVMDKYNGRIDGQIQYVPDTLHPKFDTIVALEHQWMYVAYHSKYAFAFEGNFRNGAAYVDSTLNFQYDEIVLFPCRFVRDMIHEIIGVRIGNLWGYMKIYNGPKVLTPPKYLSITTLNRGIGLVEYSPGRYGYVDHKGTEYFCED